MAKKIIDTTEKPKKKTQLPIKTITIIVAILVLVAAGVIAWLYVQQKANNSNGMVQSPSTEPNDVVKNVLEGTTKPGSNESKQQLEAALGKASTDEEKMKMLQLLANDAYARNDFKATAGYAIQAYEVKKNNPLLAQSVATLYDDKLQDKPQALKYYKIARSLSDTAQSDDPMQEDWLVIDHFCEP